VMTIYFIGVLFYFASGLVIEELNTEAEDSF